MLFWLDPLDSIMGVSARESQPRLGIISYQGFTETHVDRMAKHASLGNNISNAIAFIYKEMSPLQRVREG